MTQVGLFQVWRLDLTFEDQSMNYKTKTICLPQQTGKSLDRIQYPFLIKLLANKKPKGTFLT